MREYLGLRYPPNGTHEWCPGHVVAAVLDAPAHRPILLASCYLINGIGPTQKNLELLAEVGRRKQAVQEEYELVLGGDFNLQPPEMASTGFEEMVDAAIMCPATARGTYRSAGAASLLDYFLVSSRLAVAVDQVATIEAAGTRGHVPVSMRFKPRATSLRALHLRRPPKLEVERIYGPIAPPPDWSTARRQAERALQAARSKDGRVQAVLDDAYKAWANLAEAEIASYTGIEPRKYGERGKLPNLVWRSVIPESTPKRERPCAAAAAWLAGVTGELLRVCAAVGARMDGEEQQHSRHDE